MMLVPSVGHTGHRNLIAYICLADALDRNGEVMIFWGWGGGGECRVCSMCVLYHLTRGQHMSVLKYDYHKGCLYSLDISLKSYRTRTRKMSFYFHRQSDRNYQKRKDFGPLFLCVTFTAEWKRSWKGSGSFWHNGKLISHDLLFSHTRIVSIC